MAAVQVFNRHDRALLARNHWKIISDQPGQIEIREKYTNSVATNFATAYVVLALKQLEAKHGKAGTIIHPRSQGD